MKRWMILGCSLSGLFLTAIWLYAQSRPAPPESEKKEKHTISAAGSATVLVKPDSARVFFSVQTIGKTLKTARQENDTKTRAVLSALKELQIADLRSKTANVHVDIVESPRGEGVLPDILGYRVTNSFTVLVQDTDSAKLSTNASRILDTALENGANNVQQIVFFRKDEAAVRRQALSKAVEDALANAKALAVGAHVDVKDTIVIEGQSDNYYVQQQLNVPIRPSSFAGAETPVVAGDLEITCRVNITCTY